MVLSGHLYGTAHYPKNSLTSAISHTAHLGVQIFFVISGFLITSLLVKEKEQTGRIDFLRFYIRRTLRIFPAAFFYITVVAVLAHPGYLWYAYTYTMCYASQARPWLLGHLWSLSVEEQFYLLWPAVLMISYRYRFRVGLVVLYVASLARFLFWRAGLHEIDEYFPAVMDNMMMGCLLAFSVGWLRQKAAWLKHWATFTVLGVLTIVSPHLLPRVRLQIFAGGLVPLIISLFIFSAIERADWFLNNRLTAFVGVLSYSLYLWQQVFLNRGSLHWWTQFPVNVGFAFFCALVSYHFVERPFLKFFHGPRLHQPFVPATNSPRATAGKT